MATMTLRQHDEVVLLLGAPGAGKGTQARFLAEMLGVPHVASGDLLRQHRQRGTGLGRTAQQYMDRGDLVPDALVVDMIAERLGEPDAARGALLDGFPRTVAQAEALEQCLEQRGGAVRMAVYVEVPTEVLIDRLSGRWLCVGCQASYHETYNPPAVAAKCDTCGCDLHQREDDTREVVTNRVAVYLRDTLPVVERYAEQGNLVRVDGNQAIDDVWACMRREINRRELVPA
jgi:adenylate kinase